MKSGRIFFGLIFFLVVACPTLAQEVGKIMSIVGTAEVIRKEQWQSISLHEALQPGDVVRTGPGSRVAVLLADGSQLKVNANSQLLLKQVASPTRHVAMRLVQSLLRLFSGEIWIRSLGEPLEIETLAATAILRGTELNLAVESTDTARLAVVEGVVEFHNPKGSVLVGAQEQALAKVGEAPRKTVLLNPLDAVQWSLYYPGIVSYRDYSLAEVNSTLLQKRLTELERRAAAAPQDINVVIALGEALFDLGKRTEARRQFERALRLAPRDPRAHTGLGWVYLEAGESEAALRQFHQAEPSTLMSLVGKAHALYRLNRFEEALEVIARAKQRFPKSPRPWTQAALIALVQGRVPEALVELDRALRLDPKYALTHGLRSNIYLVRNQKERALEAAQQAVAANPYSPAAHLDLSLVKQAEFKLEEALKTARKAVALDPENPQALIQASRLLFGQGKVDEAFKFAERARRLAPQDPVVLSTWGFLQLARERVNEAIAVFDRAIVQDSTRGEPHLGKGLALFRRGKTEEGVEEMRVATLLEPKVSLYHSYLGKAFYEVKESKLAGQQLALAKELDPRDPTPYFYDAIRKQSVNRPVEALHDLQKSVELNDNRAVYRSRLLLDEDVAARSANLARIYDNLGFEQRARLEAWKSVNSDPTDFSAHRFLADSYATLQRHEIARVSELLQSQLLQPANISPLQPQLVETNLAILEGAGPSNSSFNEFSPFFRGDNIALQANTIVGNNGTFGDDAVLSIIQGPFSGSAGQFHFETNGFRGNSDLTHNIYNVFGQWSFSPKASVQIELRRRETESGDVALSIEPNDPDLRRQSEQDSARFGTHYGLTPRQDVIASFIYQNSDSITTDLLSETRRLNISDLTDGYNIEFQHLYRGDRIKTISGIGYIGFDEQIRITGEILSDSSVVRRVPLQGADDDPEVINGYLYVHMDLGSNAILTLGASYDSFHELGVEKHQANPKFGLIWNPTAFTTLRLAAFRVLKRPFVLNRTIEPTQLAGFNQLYDDTNGSDSTRYGVGLDHRLSSNLFTGFELTWRDLDRIRVSPGEAVPEEKEGEVFHRAYIYWAPYPFIGLGAEYQFEEFEREPVLDQGQRSFKGIPELRTHSVPLSFNYYHPNGFFAEAKATYVHQEIDFDQTSPNRHAEEQEDFWVVDASVGYRLPKRFGLVSIDVRNLLDEDFSFQNTFDVSEPRIPRFQPERAILAKLNLWFY
jgi:tetratricopeptide (TPR) repeat protein